MPKNFHLECNFVCINCASVEHFLDCWKEANESWRRSFGGKWSSTKSNPCWNSCWIWKLNICVQQSHCRIYIWSMKGNTLFQSLRRKTKWGVFFRQNSRWNFCFPCCFSLSLSFFLFFSVGPLVLCWCGQTWVWATDLPNLEERCFSVCIKT